MKYGKFIRIFLAVGMFIAVAISIFFWQDAKREAERVLNMDVVWKDGVVINAEKTGGLMHEEYKFKGFYEENNQP